MSVIGRLDEQVAAVLITPLERRGEPTGDGNAAAARSNENIERPQSAIQTALEVDPQQDARFEREELPVWLL